MNVLFLLMIAMLSAPVPGEFGYALPGYRPQPEAKSCEASASQAYPSAEHGGQSRLMPHWSAM